MYGAASYLTFVRSNRTRVWRRQLSDVRGKQSDASDVCMALTVISRSWEAIGGVYDAASYLTFVGSNRTRVWRRKLCDVRGNQSDACMAPPVI